MPTLPNCLKQEGNIDKLSIPDLFLFINKDPLLRNVQLDSKLYRHHSQSCQRLFFFFFNCTLFHQKWSTPISVPSISGEISPFICKHLHFFVTLLQHLQCLIDRGSQQYTFISFIQVIQFCNLHIETLKSVLLVNYNNAYYLRKKFVQRKQRALLYISAHT